jgi:dTDP-4-dehydrorhamnose 3,5-epimerase
MIFEKTLLDGAFMVRIQPREDERGLFARTFCRDEFSINGLPGSFVQCSVSWNRLAGTLRGLHFQRQPHAEGKLVRCTMGAAYDVIVDLRPHSETYCRWLSFELTANNRMGVYVPPGFAHGFQTLTAETEIFYQMTETYSAESAAGVRWNDPAFGIEWPLPVASITDRDALYPDFVK